MRRLVVAGFVAAGQAVMGPILTLLAALLGFGLLFVTVVLYHISPIQAVLLVAAGGGLLVFAAARVVRALGRRAARR